MSIAKTRIAAQALGEEGAQPFVWAHGWGQSGASLRPLARSLGALGRHTLLDLPGFGGSDAPPEGWGTADYADAIAETLEGPVTWIGHSFGGRVGIQLAARHPGLVSRLVLVASAGLPRRRPLWQALWLRARVAAFKACRRLAPERARDWFGSADYRAAGPLRAVFVRVVSEDLSEQAATVRCPTLLLYGERDTETPPEIGRRLAALIPGARLEVLGGLDHDTVLTTGRHRTAAHIKDFAA